MVSARSVEARLGRQHAHERGEVAAQQRLAAGEPQLVDAEREEDVDERADLLEVQHVLARQPDVVRPPACSTRSAGCSGR